MFKVQFLCLQDLGYKNDVGYQTFLYHNESELRQVFMFLIERLPNEGKQVTSIVPSANRKALFLQDISNKIGEELQSMWIPPCCKTSLVKIGEYYTKGKSQQYGKTFLLNVQPTLSNTVAYHVRSPVSNYKPKCAYVHVCVRASVRLCICVFVLIAVCM